MNGRILNIIGRFIFVVALSAPFMVGCTKKVVRFNPIDYAWQVDPEPEELYWEAIKQYDNEKYKVSSEKFVNLIGRFPNNVHLQAAIIKIVLSKVKLADSQGDETQRNKIYDELFKQCRDFKDRFPKDESLVDKLVQYISAVRLHREIQRGEQVLNQRLPGNHYFIEVKPSPREYIDEFLKDELLQESPYSELKGEGQFLIAQLFLNRRNYPRAYQEFDKIATEEFREYPSLQADAMYYAALCLKVLGVYDEALGRYTDFMTRFPGSKKVADAYFDIAEIYADTSINQKDYYDYHAALQNFDFALKNTVDSGRRVEIQIAIGQTHYNEGVYEKAFAAYELVLAQYPDNVLAKFYIANLHFHLGYWDKSIDWHKGVIKEYDASENEPLLTSWISGEPKYPSLIAASVYEISGANYRLALQHQDEDKKQDARKKLKEALKWCKKLIVEKGFKDDNVPETLKERDFRMDALAPVVLHQAMLILNSLGELGKLGNVEELELYKILDVSVRELSEPGIQGVLQHIVGQYISDFRDDRPLLAAEAQLKFAHIKRDKFKRYNDAAEEYKRLWTDYLPQPDLLLNLLKLQGKYYEGLCYEQGTKLDRSIEAYQKALTLFKTTFQPLIDYPNIDPSHINKEAFDYCIQTAKEYAEKISDKLEKAKQKPDDADEEQDSSNTSDNPDSSKESQTEEPLTVQNIAEIASGSTVYIETETAEGKHYRGSGFFIKPGLIATNYHVISGKVRGTARLVGTNRKYALIGYTAIDPDYDLAILKVKAFGIKPLSLGDSEKVDQGASVYPVGNPSGLVNVVSDGQISSVQWVESIRKFFNNGSGVITDVQQDDTPSKLLLMTAPTSGGNSGGPVLNGEGKVIGISVGGMTSGENLNFAVPVNYLKALLKRTGPSKPLSDLEIVY